MKKKRIRTSRHLTQVLVFQAQKAGGCENDFTLSRTVDKFLLPVLLYLGQNILSRIFNELYIQLTINGNSPLNWFIDLLGR